MTRKRDEIILLLQKEQQKANILAQRYQAHIQLFAVETQAGNNMQANEFRCLLHAMLDEMLDSSAQSTALCNEMYFTED